MYVWTNCANQTKPTAQTNCATVQTNITTVQSMATNEFMDNNDLAELMANQRFAEHMADQYFANEVYNTANMFLARCNIPELYVDQSIRQKHNVYDNDDNDDDDDDDSDDDVSWPMQTQAFCALETLAHVIASKHAPVDDTCSKVTKQRLVLVSFYKMLLLLQPSKFGHGDDAVLDSMKADPTLCELMKEAMAIPGWSREAKQWGRQYDAYHMLKAAFS
jgi:hypothetical protein